MKRYISISILCSVVVLFFSTIGCKRNRFFTDSSAQLQFSTDTLTFDTVFTTVGSITRSFKVFNPYKETLKIDQIALSDASNSPFRINVDGVPGPVVKNIEIPAEDYIYIFAEVTVDPNNQSAPFVLLDEIEYLFNNTSQKSYLMAWGQNAYFHYGEILESVDTTWTNDKPHVLVGNSDFPGVGVDSFSVLRIQPGCQIYSYTGAGIFVDGHLIVGAPNSMDSVVFQSARIESTPSISFEDRPGLWFGIALLSGSKGEFYTTHINQATYGIMGRFIFSDDFSGFDASSRPDITLDRVVIKNSLQNALITLNAQVQASNCLFYNSGSNLVALALGGTYQFDNCTFNNVGVPGLSHDDEMLVLSNFASNGFGYISDLENASFTNCIVYGSQTEEIVLSQEEAAGFQYSFENCLIRTEIDVDEEPGFLNCIVNESPLFEEEHPFDYRLSDQSPCIDAGKDNGITSDINFTNRTLPVDIGAYEFL